jgi:peptidyl-prolyl cis-trans isomerase C
MGQRIVLAIVLAVIVSSCEKKATGQAVAVVNNEEITASELNGELASEHLPVTDTPRDSRAQALQRLIDRHLIAQQARAQGIDKSPEFLNQLRRTTDDLLINMLIARQAGSAHLPSPDEISRYEASRPEMFANREIWTLQQIIYPLPKNSALSAKLAAAKTLDEVAQILTSSGVQFTRGSKQIDSAIFPHAIYAQLAGLKEGEPFIAPGPDKAIASVITARQPAPIAGDQARKVALQVMRREQIAQMVQQRVKSLKATAKIEYQTGFAPPKS